MTSGLGEGVTAQVRVLCALILTCLCSEEWAVEQSDLKRGGEEAVPMSCQMDGDSSSSADIFDQDRDGEEAGKCCVKQLSRAEIKKGSFLSFFCCLVYFCFPFISLPFLFVSVLSL